MADTKRKILLIDDSEITLEMEKAVLTRAGFEVRTAEDITQFDDVLADWSPEIVLTDVEMPGMGGHELCRVLKAKLDVLIPVVLFSALPEHQLKEIAESCGADGYLSKVNGIDRLPEHIAELCESILW